MKQQFLEHAVF